VNAVTSCLYALHDCQNKFSYAVEVLALGTEKINIDMNLRLQVINVCAVL